MKVARLNLFLMLSAAALLAGNWSVRRSHSPSPSQPQAGEMLTPAALAATKPGIADSAQAQTAGKPADPTSVQSSRRGAAAKSPLAYSAPGVD